MPDHDSTQQDLEDELNAYLDGELDAENVRRVEERLARDPEYRRELQKLERAWNLLDSLPRASVDDAFTRSTIEMVATSASQEAEALARELPRRRRQRRIVGAISMLAALAVGFAIGRGIWRDPNRQLLDDLPVLENLDLYYQADDIEFLRLLDERGLFNDGDSEHAG
jgi:anti-sigma factor RsiW